MDGKLILEQGDILDLLKLVTYNTRWDKDNPTRVLFERIVKQRFDRGQPSLFASNAGPEAIALDPSMGGYGETVWSVISGSCKDAVMDPGDFRKQHLAARAKAKIWRDG